MNDSVAILLSTKNGAAYVFEQLVSIGWQSHDRWKIFWRDDGSTDQTIRIVRKILNKEPLGTDPVGITKSYAYLLHTAWTAGYDLFAFADQDDVWAIDKVERGVSALTSISGPALYCARQNLVNAKLQSLGVSPPINKPIGFPAALTQNIAAGCTIMINRPAAELLINTLREQRYHDWWCYIMVAAAGGRIIVDDAEVIQYRQHTNNVIGAPAKHLPRAIAALRRGRHAFMSVFREHIVMLQMHRKLLSQQACHDCDVIAAALQAGPRARWQALRLAGFRRQGIAEDLLFRLWFMIG